MTNRILLPVKVFKQKTNECAICACSSIANYYNRAINYSTVQKMVSPKTRKNGLYTIQQAGLLNKLGFKNVTIVTNDLGLVDYSWSSLDKKNLIDRLRKLFSHIKRSMSHASPYSSFANWQRTRKQCTREMIKWLESSDFNNRLVIDHDFPKYIVSSINKGHPVSISINATSMFKLRKGGSQVDGDIKGDVSEHAIVIRGYDDKGVFVVDSDYSKKSKGSYKISWVALLANMPSGGDLILVGDF